METPLPRGWKPLHLDRYDGTTDPDEHIDSYTTQVNLYTNSHAILCRVFPTSLKGPALHWYTQLPAGSIDSFCTLVRRFVAQYATSRPHHTTSAALANLRQNDDESLRDFIERFSNISVQIRNLNPKVALHAMLMALKPGSFIDSLCHDAPPTWMSCVPAPPATFRWKSTRPSATKFGRRAPQNRNRATRIR
uniref:Retrotransposon gag domain-containing protein n=1 Tax=Cajanus cajan TaxID=3821 RepID=A0A151SFG6_CAJCA|nr:hypothetical protein KK1_024616 [Cajanus cajan]